MRIDRPTCWRSSLITWCSDGIVVDRGCTAESVRRDGPCDRPRRSARRGPLRRTAVRQAPTASQPTGCFERNSTRCLILGIARRPQEHRIGRNGHRRYQPSLITFRVSRRRLEMYRGHARLCVSVCLSAAACPRYCTDPDVTWGSGSGCPLVV